MFTGPTDSYRVVCAHSKLVRRTGRQIVNKSRRARNERHSGLPDTNTSLFVLDSVRGHLFATVQGIGIPGQ